MKYQRYIYKLKDNNQIEYLLFVIIHLICFFYVFNAQAKKRLDYKDCPIQSNKSYQKMIQLNSYQEMARLSLHEKEKKLKDLERLFNNQSLLKHANLEALNQIYKTTEQISLVSINILVDSYCSKQDQVVLNQLNLQMENHLTLFK